MRDERPVRRGDEAGFALIMAILSLMLLTFLGLTLAATTSTELQIATNYRWAKQAYYNAEAGIEVARYYLRSLGGTAVLPDVRPVTWVPNTTGNAANAKASRVDVWGYPSRNFEPQTVAGASNCDSLGGGVGYGAIFDDGSTFGLPLQNVSVIRLPTGEQFQLNGAFTVWARRAVMVDGAGNIRDDPDDQKVILVSEGVAPFTGAEQGAAGAGAQFMRANRAVHVLETVVNIVPPCKAGGPQTNQTGKENCDLP
jgi:type IV pilus assembly PilX-like protein